MLYRRSPKFRVKGDRPRLATVGRAIALASANHLSDIAPTKRTKPLLGKGGWGDLLIPGHHLSNINAS